MKKAQETVSSAFEQWSEIKAGYRFFSNAKVTTASILKPHQEQTQQRINDSKRVLLLQDTTYIDYKNRHKTQDLDCVILSPKAKNKVKGLILHSQLAVNTEGLPLGIVNQQFTERKECEGSKINRKNHAKKSVKEKESYRWIKMIKDFQEQNEDIKNSVHVADREGDIYELYQECVQLEQAFLIRGCWNRAINKKHRREPPKEKMFDYFENLKPSGYHKIEVQANGEKKYREAKLAVSYAKLTIPPPPSKTVNKDGAALLHVEMWGILAHEKSPPKGIEPIKWLLLTNIPVKTLVQAIEKVTWYSYRWNIELFHKILKSGCAVEQAQLRSGQKLKKYITLKSIIAWRLFWMTRFFNQEKQQSCASILSTSEWTLLYRRFNQGRLPEKPPSIKDIYYWIAKLGGYINRNTDSPPGIISIWKGWTRFMDMIQDYQAIYG